MVRLTWLERSWPGLKGCIVKPMANGLRVTSANRGYLKRLRALRFDLWRQRCQY
jgi:hypothetical protein